MSARESILDLKARMAQSIIGQEQVVERLLLTLRYSFWQGLRPLPASCALLRSTTVTLNPSK
jgi:hypothetical protein